MLSTWIGKIGLGKDKSLMIQSPIAGEVLPLSEVGDPVFKEKILGDGLAIKPHIGRVVAPVDGTVSVLMDTKHAISILSEQGTEILIHIGVDTVKLKGEFFKAAVIVGEKVMAGDLLLEFDMKQIEAAGYSLITPVVICNTADYSEIIPHTGKSVKELEKLITIKK